MSCETLLEDRCSTGNSNYIILQSPEYSYLKNTVTSLKVMNDAAERGIHLLDENEDTVTLDSDQRNIILHRVEYIRKLHPNFEKPT